MIPLEARSCYSRLDWVGIPAMVRAASTTDTVVLFAPHNRLYRPTFIEPEILRPSLATEFLTVEGVGYHADNRAASDQPKLGIRKRI